MSSKSYYFETTDQCDDVIALMKYDDVNASSRKTVVDLRHHVKAMVLYKLEQTNTSKEIVVGFFKRMNL